MQAALAHLESIIYDPYDSSDSGPSEQGTYDEELLGSADQVAGHATDPSH